MLVVKRRDEGETEMSASLSVAVTVTVPVGCAVKRTRIEAVPPSATVTVAAARANCVAEGGASTVIVTSSVSLTPLLVAVKRYSRARGRSPLWRTGAVTVGCAIRALSKAPPVPDSLVQA